MANKIPLFYRLVLRTGEKPEVNKIVSLTLFPKGKINYRKMLTN